MSQLRMRQVSDFNAFLIESVALIYQHILTVNISDNINAVHDKFLVREAHDQEQENLKKQKYFVLTSSGELTNLLSSGLHLNWLSRA